MTTSNESANRPANPFYKRVGEYFFTAIILATPVLGAANVYLAHESAEDSMHQYEETGLSSHLKDSRQKQVYEAGALVLDLACVGLVARGFLKLEPEETLKVVE